MGGQLRIHLDAEADGGGPAARGGDDKSCGRTWDVEPFLDRLVLFRSDVVDHEVRETLSGDATAAVVDTPGVCSLDAGCTARGAA